ncbi:MAG: hypothetical protein AB7F35_27055 [Acetobacteraceae bacterium]
MPQFRDHLKRTLAQDFSGVEFPFIWLNPEYCWHGGFYWWEAKLREVITIIAKQKFQGRYLDALRDVSTRLANIELIPYHSSSFSAHQLIRDLPSVHAARHFAQAALVANQGMKKIIVTRQVKSWDLPPNNADLIVYEGGHTRGASLGSRSRGGQAILKLYEISDAGDFP